MNRSWPVLALLGSSVLWGLTWLPLKYFGAHGVEGPLVSLCAHGAVGMLVLPWLWRERASLKKAPAAMLWLCFFGGLANVSFASAMVLGDVTRVMALFYLLPAWGVLGGRLLLGERIDRRRGTSLICALLGAALILGGPGILNAPPSFVDLTALISGMAFAMNNVLFRRAWQVEVVTKVGVSFVGCLAWAGLLMAFGAGHVPASVPSLLWVELVAFGLIWIGFATLGTLWAVNQMEAGRSSVLIIMELVTAVVSASLLTGDTPLPLEWAGGALILFSALLEARRAPAPDTQQPGGPAVCSGTPS